MHEFPHELGINVQLPSLFLHNGFAIATGGPSGDVGIWDVCKGMKIQTLRHSAVVEHLQRMDRRFLPRFFRLSQYRELLLIVAGLIININ